jgi:hypothetical protein
MASWFTKVIPVDPLHVPPRGGRAAAARYLRRAVGPARQVHSDVTDEVHFVDAGGNWEGVFCPACGADLEEWWGEAMTQAFDASRFARLRKRVPCCRRISSLNELRYPWAVGFARYSLRADEPQGELEPRHVAQLEVILGCRVRVIRGRI